ncbi:MAG TPA: carboxylesterase family protein [Aldersonia sp.]
MDTVVHPPSGSVRGTTTGDVSRFLGVPYAASPAVTGWLEPPGPVEPWAGVRDALEYGATVPKNPYPWPSSELLEDAVHTGDNCLNLNVWTPDVTGSAPVFVWIHGGAFRNGTGSAQWYDGTAFARDGVVCVTINYRLGVYGFVDVDDTPANVGLRDQLAALRWVRDNIAAFGGNPDRVTVGGESAGAMSVAALLSSPLAEGLFAGAILQSGAGHHALTRECAQNIGTELARRLDVPASRAAVAGVPEADLLAAQADLLRDVQGDVARWGEAARNLMAFEPVIGDDVLPALPIESIRAGAGGDVRVLIGTNADEMRFFMVPSGAVDLVTTPALSAAVDAYGFADVPAVLDVLDAYPEGSPGDRLAAVVGDWFFWIPAIRLAEAREQAAPTYVYEFAWPSTARDGRLGACHALEIPFVFDTLDVEDGMRITGTGAPQSIAKDMHAAWVSFVTDGDPGWSAYQAEERTVRVFDTEPSTVVDPRPQRRAVWDGVR